jgi:hypothetical protein
VILICPIGKVKIILHGKIDSLRAMSFLLDTNTAPPLTYSNRRVVCVAGMSAAED